MAMTLRNSGHEGWVEITVSGRVRETDILTVLSFLRQAIERSGSIRLVEVVTKLDDYDFRTVAPLLEANGDHLAKVTHIAAVSDHASLGPITRAATLMAPIEFRSFLTHDRDAARAWVAQPDEPTAPNQRPDARILAVG